MSVDYRRMEELMQELEEEKRARRKLEWELVEETEARTEQERQLKAERAHNNLLRQRYAPALHKLPPPTPPRDRPTRHCRHG